MATSITFIGTSAVRPAIGGESACLLVNDDTLIDVGWCSVLHMRTLGVDPAKIEHVFFTHFHHDHYLGLPQLLFLLGPRAGHPLTLIGPAEDLDLVVDRSLEFLQAARFPHVVPEVKRVALRPGDGYETSTHTIATTRSLHPVPALTYRFTDKETGAAFTYTGDTGYNPELAEFARGSEILVHEASYADRLPPDPDPWGHSAAAGAAKIAAEAAIPRLFLVHCEATRREAAVESARRHHGNVTFPHEGLRVALATRQE